MFLERGDGMERKQLNFILIFLGVSVVLNGALTIYLFSQNSKQDAHEAFSLEDMETVAEEARAEAAAVVANPQKAIANMVIERKIVKDEYLVYIKDEALLQKINEYNIIACQLRPQLEYKVITALENCFDMDIDVENYMKLPPEVTYVIKKIAHYSMYTNAVQLIYNDAELSQMMAMEPAKSNEEWKNFIKNETNIQVEWLDTHKFYPLINEIVSTLYDGEQDILEKVLAREIIEDTYFMFVKDSTLLDKIKEYNELTAKTKLEYTDAMIWYTKIHFVKEFDHEREYKEVSKLNYFNRTKEQKLFVPRLAHHALYRMACDLIYNDPIISPMLVQKEGRTASEWPDDFRNTMTELWSYYDFVDELIELLQ